MIRPSNASPRLGARLGVRPAARGRLALALACLGGLGGLAFLGAPMTLLAINAAALGLAVLLILVGRPPKGRATRLGLAIGLLIVLALPLLTGPQISGVARWLSLGPLALHTAALCLPALIGLMAEDERSGPLVLAAAAAVLSWQPDAAGLLALGLASGVLAAQRRSLALAVLAAACLALCGLTFAAGPLEPQPFVEAVLFDLAERSWLAAAGVALALAAAIGLMVWAPGTARAPALALAALLAGFTLAAMLGPFPYPLIGYGASPILGFGLAFGFCAERGQAR